MKNRLCIVFFCFVMILSTSAMAVQTKDPLPSWNNGPIKQSILDFVGNITDTSNPQFVPKENRIAVFDNDGTLWVEHPMYTQVLFNQAHPEIQKPGTTVEEYQTCAREWLAQAKSPRYQRLYTELVYQPMLEVMQYLRDHDFTIYIVSGGGQDFIRSYAEKSYQVPPEHVIGTTVKTTYTEKRYHPVLVRTKDILLLDDNTRKPQDIHLFIGKKPIIAFGNSDGDREMLEWTQSSKGQHLMFLVHHDDAKREYAYGANTKVGTFSDSLMEEALNEHWGIIRVEKDWNRLFPFPLEEAPQQAEV